MRTNTKKRGSVNLAKVAKIEEIQNEDVYNMEVVGTHNFSVNNGIIVHNCMDEIRYLCYTIMRHKAYKREYTSIFDR